MRKPKIDLLETIEVNGMPLYLVTKEVIENYIYLKEASRRKSHSTNIISKQEVLDLLSCSEATLYRKMKQKGCLIKRGRVSGTYLRSSVFRELAK